MLKNLQIVMVKTRFPENIGMAARACANMGCHRIVLVAPERWDRDKARPLATAKGEGVLDGVRVVASLEEALADSVLAVGTTARTGGWRREIIPPEAAAAAVAPLLDEGARVSLVFGPEDRGLNNQEIELCQRLVTIPTADASSLNVAQSILLLLYECHKAMRRPAGQAVEAGSARITVAEQERLTATLRETLLWLDFLHGDNPDYFLMPWRRFVGRAGLRRHEYDALMGFCRQIRNKLLRGRQ